MPSKQLITWIRICTILLVGLSLMTILKVLTHEKREGLNLVSFDSSCFTLFTLKCSKESVQTLSREKPKIAQGTLFLSFVIVFQ
jgi:hypothetical protein